MSQAAVAKNCKCSVMYKSCLLDVVLQDEQSIVSFGHCVNNNNNNSTSTIVLVLVLLVKLLEKGWFQLAFPVWVKQKVMILNYYKGWFN